MKILLMGPPACGKGTIGSLLSDKLRIPLISVGQLLRNIPPEHKLYEKVQSYMAHGKLLPAEIAGEVLKERLQSPDCQKGYIADGWARNLENLNYFDPSFDLVILLNVSDDTVIKRVSGRRMCEATGDIINIYTIPQDQIKECPSGYIQRDDDKEEVVKERLLSYKKETKPVIDIFKKQKNLIEVDGEPSPEEVFKNVCKALHIA